VYKDLSRYFMIDYDDTGSIGKRYRRQDEVGTPFCVTIDFETEETGTVTVRHRDSMAQERVAIKDLESFIRGRIQF
jgi:glycyl-tRNA synthetase